MLVDSEFEMPLSTLLNLFYFTIFFNGLLLVKRKYWRAFISSILHLRNLNEIQSCWRGLPPLCLRKDHMIAFHRGSVASKYQALLPYDHLVHYISFTLTAC